MARFTTIVEIYNTTSPADYEVFNTEMEKEGFKRTIQKQDEPAVYQMPTGIYNLISNELSTDEVVELAKKAGTRTGKKFSVFVAKSDAKRVWDNLIVLEE